MTYERALFGSAGREKFSFSTLFLERKIMSTKTTIKRISAVAALALAFGGLSTVAANAAPTADTLAVSSTAVTATSSVQSQVAVTQAFLAQASGDQGTITAALIAAPAGNVAIPTFETPTVTGYTDARATRASSAGAAMTTVVSNGSFPAYVSATYNLNFTPVVAGTYTVKVIPSVANGVTAATSYATAQTITYTVAAKAAPTSSSTAYMIPAYSYSNSNGSFDTAGGTYTGTINSTTNVSSTPCYADPRYAGAQCASIRVTMSNASGSTASNLASGDATDITASISGPGTIALATGTALDNNQNPYTVFGNNGVAGAGAKATYTSSTVNTYQRTSLTKDLVVYQDGTPGTAIVTISTAAGVVIGTKSVVFYGNAAKIASATVVVPVIAASTSGNAGAITAYVYDANGVAVPGVTLYALSDNTAIASNTSAVSSSTGKVSFTLTAGSTAGVANFKITDASSLTGTATLTGVTSVAVRVGSATVASYKISTDKASYVPGEIATVSILMLDASGNPVTDSTAVGGTFTSTNALPYSGFSNAGTPTAGTGNGIYSFKVNMPISAGSVDLTFTPTSATPALAATTATVVVNGGASADAANAAADAAAEATDAANAATDAANAAADSADQATAAAQDAGDKADAALAAVTALSQQVTDLLAKIQDLSDANMKLADSLAAQSAALAAQSKVIAAQSKTLAKIAKKVKA
jgi:trimeric autotransporter adhesin